MESSCGAAAPLLLALDADEELEDEDDDEREDGEDDDDAALEDEVDPPMVLATVDDDETPLLLLVPVPDAEEVSLPPLELAVFDVVVDEADESFDDEVPLTPDEVAELVLLDGARPGTQAPWSHDSFPGQSNELLHDCRHSSPRRISVEEHVSVPGHPLHAGTTATTPTARSHHQKLRTRSR